MSKDPRDRYGPPFEDSKEKRITGTAKQVLETSKNIITSPSSSQNRYYPLLPSTPTQSIRPRMQTLLLAVSTSSKALQETPPTPLQTQHPTTKPSEKLPFYTPPSSQAQCPFVEKPYKLPLFTLESEYYQNNGSLLQTISKCYPPRFHSNPKH